MNNNQGYELFSPPEDQPIFSGSSKTWDDALKPKKTIQLAASGEVMITIPEMEIIDTRSFQRLRRVRQLGAACVVYPTALHTRFDHSLGTLEMVWRMIQAIIGNKHNSPETGKVTPRQRCLARIYALIHDVPHIPFGHSIEDELGIFERHDKNEARIEHFLGENSEIGRVIIRHFGPEFHADLLRLYLWDEKPGSWKGQKEDVFVHDLVSNTVCADLLDYLRRDDFFCNLGVSIRYQFINYLYIEEEKGTKLRRIFVRLSKHEGVPRRDLLSDLCRLLQARYLIAERVYFHHAKITAGAMLGRAIQEASLVRGADGVPELTEEKMYAHSDDTLVDALEKSINPIARKLAKAYTDRALYEVWVEKREADIEQAQNTEYNTSAWAHLETTVMNSHERLRLENLLTEFTFTEPGDILFYAPDRKMNQKAARMRVLWKGEQKEFQDIDDDVTTPNIKSTLDAHRRLWSMRVLARRGLDKKVRETAIKFVQIEFFTLDEQERAEQRRRFCKSVVRRAAELGKWPGGKDATELGERIQAGAGELMEIYDQTVVHYKGESSVQERLAAIKTACFPG